MTKNYLILIVGLILILVATFMFYKKAQKNEKTQTIIPNNLVPGPIVHDKLSDEQIEKITKIQTVFYDVYPVSLEETITNFRRDRNPDNEIKVWFTMMQTYEKFVSNHPDITLEKKSEAFKLILTRSMMDEDKVRAQTETQLLTNNEVNEIFSYYTEKSQPLLIEKSL
ncbi:hypothetical protein [Flavobacterium bizetiae]|uniref:hypothetical protein n=1 Tax=Flavobacterium bizetiae TaxID=2704140 RepID=UPI003758271B